jgi:hypothetical protein
LRVRVAAEGEAAHLRGVGAEREQKHGGEHPLIMTDSGSFIVSDPRGGPGMRLRVSRIDAGGAA